MTTIKDYIERKYFRLYTPALRENGKWYRFVAGKWIPEKEFNKLYPPLQYVKENPNNPDIRKSYLHA